MFYNLKKIDSIHPLFQAMENTRGVSQCADYHPEGDVFTHSVQVLQIAMRESNDLDLIFAAMCHDVGKIVGTLGHEKYSCDLLKGQISEKTEWLISQHIRVKWFLSGEMKKRGKVEYLYTHPFFADLILLNRWDTMGRNPLWKPKYDRVEIIERMVRKSKSLDKQRTNKGQTKSVQSIPLNPNKDGVEGEAASRFEPKAGTEIIR